MFKKLGLYYRTIKHLKPIQIRYQLWFRLREKIRKLTGHSYPLSIPKKGHALYLEESIPSPVVGHPSTKTFSFINQSHTFKESIDWNFSRYGKLWAYNLNYFDYLNQPGMTKEQGLELIGEFIKGMEHNREGLEPYPTSLRAMNWITFLSRHRVDDSAIDGSLFAQYRILMDNLEFHLLGNHLLENGCSLLFGAFYFRDERLWHKGREILISELDEQVLGDGGHFERSVMYHCIILKRLLDCCNLLSNNDIFEGQGELQMKLEQKTGLMLGWLKQMLWKNGEVPEVNDHVTEMMPNVASLFNYANNLKLKPQPKTLNKSGYRKYRGNNYEILADVGNIGPDYQPGHAHSDIFSFLLRVNGKEIITEAGTSTYENCERRIEERSATAHNTIRVNGKDQNEMWSAFRVGRRGHVEILKDKNEDIIARHDGYQFIGVNHERRFQFEQNSITLQDRLLSDRTQVQGKCYLHFNPETDIKLDHNKIEGNGFTIAFTGHFEVKLQSYQKAIGYGKLKEASVAVIDFCDSMETQIQILHQA